jgi:glycosyltransferase involved in cell wall biosynthesis
MNKTILSLIIPCYNEANTLDELLSRIKFLSLIRNDIEIVLVDNGSSDGSIDKFKSAAREISTIVPLRIDVNQGYGYGILQGLRIATGEYLGWTHADLQTDPLDILHALNVLEENNFEHRIYIKGNRCGRPVYDLVFTAGMSIFESLFFKCLLWDINAQPNIFHRSFYERWINPPNDFALDLYALVMARCNGLKILRFPVLFGARKHGVSHWNIDFRSKIKFIMRTLAFSISLRRRI